MAIYKRGEVWWMDVYAGNPKRRIRRSTGCTEETAARIVEQTAIGVNRKVTPRKRAHAIIDAVLSDDACYLGIEHMAAFYSRRLTEERSNLSEPEKRKRVSLLMTLAKWLRENTAVKSVDGIDPNVAWQFSVALGERGVSTKTRNNQVAQLSASWRVFMRAGFARENPWGIARVERNREEERTGRAFTDEEIERIMAVCREVGREWPGVVTVALYTGLRMRDVEALRWCEIDFSAGEIVKTPSKTRRKGIVVRIPLHERVRAVLEEARRARQGAEQDDGYVFPWRAAHPSMGRRHVKGDVRFAEILRRAGIVEGEGERLTFHSLRHTFVTRLAAAGVPEDVRMRLAGHTNETTHAIYTHDEARAREAIARI